MPPKLTVFLILVVFGALMAQVSARFPPVHSDEVVFSVHGYNLLTGHGHRYSLYDDVFDRSVYPIRDALPDITRILYNTWDGLWLKILGRGYRQARGSSIVAAMLVLMVLYQIGRTLQGPRLGVASAALGALNPILMVAACIVRPEILLLLGASLSLWLILRLPRAWTWKPFTVGGGIGLLSAVHWNALALAMGLMTVYALIEGPLQRLRRLVWMASGILAGALMAFRTVDPAKFLLSLRTVNYLVSTPPPILSDPWHPWRWAVQMLKTFFMGQTSFFNVTLIPDWRWAVIACWVGTLLALAGSLAMREPAPTRPRWKMALLSGAFATLATLMCLVKRQELTYVIILFPFLLPLLADCWARPSVPAAVSGIRTVAAAFLLGSVLVYARFVVRYRQSSIPYGHIVKELRDLVPDDSLRLAGPASLWFAWPTEKFRDIGAVIASGWYTEGKADFGECLSPWKPEVLVMDPLLRHRLSGPRAAFPELQKAFKTRVQYLGVIHAGETGSQTWEVYRLFWDAEKLTPLRL